MDRNFLGLDDLLDVKKVVFHTRYKKKFKKYIGNREYFTYKIYCKNNKAK